MLPYYECIPQEEIEELEFDCEFDCPKGYSWDGEFMQGSMKTVVYRGRIDGVPVLLIRPDWGACNIFKGGRIYGGSYNELEAYLYFSRCEDVCLCFMCVRDWLLFFWVCVFFMLHSCCIHTQNIHPPPCMHILHPHVSIHILTHPHPHPHPPRAALECLRVTNRQPHIIHCHEWQTSAVPMLYWDVYADIGLYKPRVMLTIHNLDNTGECRQDEFAITGMRGVGGGVVLVVWYGVCGMGCGIHDI